MLPHVVLPCIDSIEETISSDRLYREGEGEGEGERERERRERAR